MHTTYHAKGRAYGIVTGAGAALSDIIYALMTGLGMSFVMDFIDKEQNIFWLKLIGSVMLFILESTCTKQTPARACTNRLEAKALSFIILPPHFNHAIKPADHISVHCPFNMLTFVIPGNWFGQCIGYLSIVAGAMLWWLGLTYVINKMRNSFGVKGIQRLNRTIGCIVFAASIIYAIMTVFKISLY